MERPSASAPSLPPSPAKPGRRIPGITVWVIVTLCLAALGYLLAADPIGDEAILNLLSMNLIFIAGATLFIWFVFFSGYPRTLRMVSISALVLAVVGFFSIYQIDRVSGTLIPQFRSRFTPPRDATLAKATVETAQDEDLVDLSIESPTDFAQFLGPDRNAVLTDVLLERDWEKAPPQPMWKQPIGAGWSAFAARNGYAVTLEQRGDEELVTCYEVRTGKLRWVHSEAGRHQTVLGGVGPRSTPTIHGGRVYTITAHGIFLCLNGTDGKPLWRIDLLEKFGSTPAQEAAEVAWGRSSSPLIVDDLVVVPAGGPADKPVSLAAFQQESGDLVWQSGTTQISYASPTLVTLTGVRQILSVNENNVSGHDPQSGKLLWQAEWPGDTAQNANASQPMTASGDRVLLSKGYGVGGQLLQVTKDDGGKLSASVVWENHRVAKTKFTNAAIIGDHIYDLSDSLLECVELATGKHAWKGKRYGQGQLLAVGDTLLIMAENTGEVVMVDASPAKFVELGKFQALEGQTWNTLCLTGKYLLVRNSEEAACYELPLREAEPSITDK